MRKQSNDQEYAHTDERIIIGLSDSEKLIIDYIRQNTKITSKEATNITKLSSAQVRRIFVALQEKNIILAYGEGRSRNYILKT